MTQDGKVHYAAAKVHAALKYVLRWEARKGAGGKRDES